MYESGQKLSKIDIEVEVHLDDGSRFLGILALSQGQRVSDLMNDERNFIPVQLPGGSVVIQRKSAIAKVAPLDQQVDQTEARDPYDVLGVPRSVSDEELKKFYHNLCAENHPDRVQSSGLSPHFVEMANSRMIRINDAYQRILEMRQGKAGANGSAKASGSENGAAEPDPFA
ncbi:MAG: J domain-containing protein [Kiloniellales bacterium]|nr:J domain-containing protein [Kiloniellales bacterium]